MKQSGHLNPSEETGTGCPPSLQTMEGHLQTSMEVCVDNNKAAGRDDVLVEQLKHLDPKANKRLHTMLNACFTGNKILKI